MKGERDREGKVPSPSREITGAEERRATSRRTNLVQVCEVAITIDFDQASRAASDPLVYHSSICWTWPVYLGQRR